MSCCHCRCRCPYWAVVDGARAAAALSLLPVWLTWRFPVRLLGQRLPVCLCLWVGPRGKRESGREKDPDGVTHSKVHRPTDRTDRPQRTSKSTIECCLACKCIHGNGTAALRRLPSGRPQRPLKHPGAPNTPGRQSRRDSNVVVVVVVVSAAHDGAACTAQVTVAIVAATAAEWRQRKRGRHQVQECRARSGQDGHRKAPDPRPQRGQLQADGTAPRPFGRLAVRNGTMRGLTHHTVLLPSCSQPAQTTLRHAPFLPLTDNNAHGNQDFELAAWQVTYLFFSPRRVYRNVYYHKQTKNTW